MLRREDLLDLNDILQHPGRVLAVDISTELETEADVDLIQPLEGFLEAISTGNLLLITGEFKTRMVLECARCTGPLEIDLEFEIDEQFPVEGIPSSLNPQDSAKVVPDEPFELFEGNSLMVESLLRQGLLLALPLSPLCEFGWEGDCPVAIARGSILKPVAKVRPEFEGLANLLQNREEDPNEDSAP